MLTRRQSLLAATATALAGLAGADPAHAADKTIKIGINLSLTGADSQGAGRVKNAIVMAFDDANKGNAIPGHKFELLVLDDGTATAGQYDPAQAATNARKMVADKEVVAAIGPQMSGAGKAMTPILSQGGLAIITPSSTNPDISSPKFAEQYRPAGKPIYFRTVTTDAFQGPNMANFLAEKLKVKSVFVLDDSGAFGVGVANSFQKQAEAKGIKVIGRDRLDPKAADYSAILTKIKSLEPAGALLRRRDAGGGEARQAVVRHHSECHQGRAGWHVEFGPAERRRLPGGRGLVHLDRRTASDRGHQGRGVHRRLQAPVQRLAG